MNEQELIESTLITEADMAFALTPYEGKRSRLNMIGGSDVAAILGISPWATPYQLWEEKTGAPQQIEDNPDQEKRFRRGKRLEPWVVEMLQEERDVWVAERNIVHHDPEHYWMQAEVDFSYVIDPQCDPWNAEANIGNGDIKTISPFNAAEWGEQETDEIPLYYAAQFQWGLMVTGRNTCMVAALIGADDLRIYHVHRDEELIAEIRRRVLTFWNDHILARVAPAPQSSGDAKKLLARYGATFQADATLAGEIAEFRTLKAKAAEAETAANAKQEQIEVQLAATFQSNPDICLTGKITVEAGNAKLLTWNEQIAHRLNQKRLAAEMPEIAAQFTEPSTFRVLRLAKEK